MPPKPRSASTGPNLQNADVVINLDLPWNPAKLEQRIARAWRKHQTRPVHVINLVCEHSIGHRILHLLDQKQNLAQVLAKGGFIIEAVPVLSEAVEKGVESVALLENHETTPLNITFIEPQLVNNAKLPAHTATLVAQLRENEQQIDESKAAKLLDDGNAIMQHAAETLNKAALQ